MTTARVRPRRWTGGLWLGIGYALFTASLAGWAWMTISRFETAIRAEETIFTHHGAVRAEVERLRAAEENAAVEARSYLLSGFEPLLRERETARQRFFHNVAALRSKLDDRGRALLRKVVSEEAALDQQFVRAIDLKRKGGGQARGLGAAFVSSQQALRASFDGSIEALRLHEETVLYKAREESQRVAAESLRDLFLVSTCALFLALLLAAFLARAFRQIRSNEEQLALANEDLDAFAGRVAHDLRSVLAGLPIVAGLLRRGGAANPEPMAERIDKITKRARGVIDGLLAFSRAGQAPEPSASAAAADIAAGAIDDLLPLAQAQSIAIEADLEDAHARCSPTLLHVALMNLLSNAIKFSAGQRERRVKVSTRREAARCVVSVEDTGPGIAPEALPHIFEPFYRAPGAKVEGTGLGLATVRRIVEAHGGGVDVESEVGRGTVARLWFPIVAREADAVPVAPTQFRTEPSSTPPPLARAPVVEAPVAITRSSGTH